MKYAATTLRIPAMLYHEIQIRAAIDQRQIGEIVAEALTEWLAAHPGGFVRREEPK